jgi:hypothetical protein
MNNTFLPFLIENDLTLEAIVHISLMADDSTCVHFGKSH